MSRFLLPLTLALAACGPPPAPLAELSSPMLHLALDIKEGSRSLKVVGLDGGSSSSCPSIDAVATMNGALLEKVWGGGIKSELGGGPWGLPQWFDVCELPEWKLPAQLPDEAVTEFDVHDHTGRLLLGAMGLGTPRTLTWLSPASGAPRWGDLVSLQWTPAGDLLPRTYPTLVAGGRTLELQVLDSPEYSVTDGVLTFRLPPAPPDQGPTDFDGELQYQAWSVGVGVSHCEPVQGSCTGALELPGHAVSVPISVR